MNKFIGVLAALALVVGIFAVYKADTVKVPTSYGGVPTLQQSPIAFNGINHYYQPVGFSTGTTTVCTWKTNATTTIAAFGVLVATSPSSQQTYEVGVGTTPGSVTVPLIASYTVASGAQAAFTATTTATFGGSTYNDGILPPGTWVSLKNLTGTNTSTGWCTLTGRGLNGNNF